MHCSDVEVEPLPGTAKPGSTYVLFEWPDAWSRDVLDGDTLGPELSARIKDHVEANHATFLLIRHATRERRLIQDHHVYLVFADQGVTEVLHVDGPEAVLDLDLSGPGKNRGASVRTKPLLLVCTHAKRDQCCAIKGRPLVRQLQRSDDMVWETSHIKGHRFAPTMLLMPWAFSYGRMNEQAARALLEHAEAGLYFVPGNRGRGTLSAPAQAAEIAVAAELSRGGAQVGMEQLLVDAPTITTNRSNVRVTDTATGAAYEVALSLRDIGGVVDSCGKQPKTGQAWVVDAVERV
ncbi:sucrase ferredoxin [Corynebacterium sp. Q4381]|uniref:sucrase ferredoxin n=1 Tax=Corynebacterium sp. Marseille-Q4381 TaxID=3121597 RepID=UPI002FE5F213